MMVQVDRTSTIGSSNLHAGLVALALAAGLFTQASAQETVPFDLTSPLAEELLTCVGIEDDAGRLDCFDLVAAPLAQAAEEGVTVLSGEGDWDSNELILESDWRLAWNSNGSILTIELRDSVDQLVDIVGNQIGPGEGVSEVIKPGAWRLAVRAIGAWELRVVEQARE